MSQVISYNYSYIQRYINQKANLNDDIAHYFCKPPDFLSEVKTNILYAY